jgi:predicted SnoaL-like aldol condensation-catalyzing enzyme
MSRTLSLRHFGVAILVTLLSACAAVKSASSGLTPTDPKQQVVDLLKSFETGEVEARDVISSTTYIQHNLGVADGRAGLETLLASRPVGSTLVRTVRVYRDGNFVFAQTEYDFSGRRMVGFDVFRFEDGKIVEHWDNLEPEAPTANPSGHDMLDGPIDASGRDRTSANKTLMQAYMDEILNGRRDRIAGYFSDRGYIQHDPTLPDGSSGSTADLKMLSDRGGSTHVDRVARILGDGNFVLVMSEGRVGDKPSAFYDLYRIDNYKIVEHWDTISTIPPQSAWKNQNGKF